MKTYCANCKKYTKNKNFSVKRAKQSSLMLVFNCAVCGEKKLSFFKNQEVHLF